MPSKSVREMTESERRRYSLSAKTFHAILLICLILSLAAIAFGFFLYTNAVREHYTQKAQDLSQTIAALADPEIVERYGTAVRKIYHDTPAELREQQDSDAYAERFKNMQDARFEEACASLEHIRIANGLASVYVGVKDESGEHFIYVLNADPSDTERAPGRFIKIEKQYADAFNPVQSVLPALIMKTDDGGYVCTGTEPVRNEDGKTVGDVVVDIYMGEVAAASRTFLWQYCLLLAIVAIALGVIMVQHLKRNVVKPINDLADAAEEYIAERDNRSTDKRFFQDLNIHTGDEIENLSLTMADMEQQIDNAMLEIASVTSEKERLGTELSIASQIQEGMLPSIFPAFPERREFDIYAVMHTAKEVGGDFYDFFLIDDDHLAVVMADVSGKGVPAALFMMASKILINNFSSVDRTSPAHILETVNHHICLNNKAEMFVTTWLGILELSTGRLKAANAGHEYPALQRKGGQFILFKDKHGFVLGGMDGMRYQEYEVTLNSGDGLFLYTDGVTEAKDNEGRLFGTERMLCALNRDPDASPEALLDTVKREIDSFAGTTSQFDDITMLCLRYVGDTMKKITIQASTENLEQVLAFVDAELEAADCPMKAQMQIDIAVEELFVNIANYAYAPGTGTAVIGVDVQNGVAEITFADSGIPYNPLKKEDPDVQLSAEEREIGGLGIFMVKKTMDDMTYEYRDGQNLLTLRKKL